MRRIVFGTVLIVCGGLITLHLATRAGSAEPAAKTQWEYKAIPLVTLIEENKLEPALNKLGKDGWELVAVEPNNKGTEDAWRLTMYYFKRSK